MRVSNPRLNASTGRGLRCGASWSADRLLHQAVVKSHQLMVVVIFENELSRPNLRTYAQENLRAQVALQFVQRFANVRIDVWLSLFLVSTYAARSETFNLPNSETATGSTLRIAHAQLRIQNSEQSATVAGSQ